jgi:hypothetical protein
MTSLHSHVATKLGGTHRLPGKRPTGRSTVLYYVARPEASVYHLMISRTKVEGNLFLCGRSAQLGMNWRSSPSRFRTRCKSCTRALARLALS